MNITTKSWYKSLTIWFNVAMSSSLTLLSMLAQELPTMKAYIPENLYVWLFLSGTVGNILIRVYHTKTAIK